MEGIFQKYYFENGRWQLLRCQNLPYNLYDFSMVLYKGKFLIINGKIFLDDSSYTTRIGIINKYDSTTLNITLILIRYSATSMSRYLIFKVFVPYLFRVSERTRIELR
jgi:hypothetical protein